MIIHTVRRGQFVAALQPPSASVPGPIFHLALGSEGQIVVQSSAWERPGAQVWGRGTQQRWRGSWDPVLADTPCFFQVTYSLHLYSVNGKLRASLPLVEQPTALTVTEDFVLLGTAQCALHILQLNT